MSPVDRLKYGVAGLIFGVGGVAVIHWSAAYVIWASAAIGEIARSFQ